MNIGDVEQFRWRLTAVDLRGQCAQPIVQRRVVSVGFLLRGAWRIDRQIESGAGTSRRDVCEPLVFLERLSAESLVREFFCNLADRDPPLLIAVVKRVRARRNIRPHGAAKKKHHVRLQSLAHVDAHDLHRAALAFDSLDIAFEAGRECGFQDV